MESVEVLITRLNTAFPTPNYARAGDAGVDLRSTIDFTLVPGERRLVPTGIAIALPPGYVGLVHPRSGLALKHGVSILNSPGTIDSGYRGEILCILINHDLKESFSCKAGDRIAQLVIASVAHAKFVELTHLPGSTRGSGGFGSSGSQ